MCGMYWGGWGVALGGGLCFGSCFEHIWRDQGLFKRYAEHRLDHAKTYSGRVLLLWGLVGSPLLFVEMVRRLDCRVISNVNIDLSLSV